MMMTNMRKWMMLLSFMRRFHKGLKKQGYKVVKRKFPNKKKRTCYNCGSTDHFIAKCPYEIKDN